jgi:hypothetical protein
LHQTGNDQPKEQTMTGNKSETEWNELNRALTDAELDDISSAGFPYFNSDSAVYQTVMAAAAWSYRGAKYFGN